MRSLPQTSLNPSLEELNDVVDLRQKVLACLSKQYHTHLNSIVTDYYKALDRSSKTELSYMLQLQSGNYYDFLGAQLTQGVSTHDRRVVVLDLDETLVHLHNPAKDKMLSAFASLYGAKEVPKPVSYKAAEKLPAGIDWLGCTLYPRPHLLDFLQQLRGWDLDLAIFSTAAHAYILEVLMLCKVDPSQFTYIWHREHCHHGPEGVLRKNLEWVMVEGYKRGNILVVDNNRDYYSIVNREADIDTPQLWNVLQTPGFYGGADHELTRVLKRIKKLKGLDIITQRQQEQTELMEWDDAKKSYESSENKDIPFFVRGDNGHLEINPDYKRYPVPMPKAIDEI